MKQSRIEKLRQRVRYERRWLADHGATLSGYIMRYGNSTDPDKYGDGGPAIYAADLAALQRAEADLAKAEGRA